MKVDRILRIMGLGMCLGLLTGGFAFADYAQPTDSASSYSQNSGPHDYFGTLLNNLQHSVNGGIHNIQDQLSAVFMIQDHSKQVEADMREKEQDALQKQQDAHQQQEMQMENSKAQQEMQKEQQRDLMQNLRNNK